MPNATEKRIRYRCERGSTSRMREKLHHIERLGKILYVKGYRFRSTRKFDGTLYTMTHERVLVKGENGSARYDGCCWSYSGEGPCGLVELLEKCGLSREQAQQVAFTTDRKNELGTDWLVNLQG